MIWKNESGGKAMSMQRKSALTKIGFVALFLVFTALPASAFFGGKIDRFSAEQVSIEPGGKSGVMGKIYVMPGLYRSENTVEQGGKTIINIFRKDRNISYMINPEDKTYLEMSFDEKKMQEAMGQFAQTEKEEILGTETVNGYKCTKKRTETTVSIFGLKKTVKTTFWVSDRFDVPLKTENSDGSITEMRNIREGKQPASLFEPPAGYRKVAGMMQLFGAPEGVSENNDQADKEPAKEGEGFSLPKSIMDKLPKDFKFPFGDKK